jgi:hypothetical protein
MTRFLLALAALVLLASCAGTPPPPLSTAQVEQALTETCLQRRPNLSEIELRKCVLDGAQTYARGLETFEQSYPLAPIRVLCNAAPTTGRSFDINCK